MLGIAVGAATLGIIIAVMEEDEFPGWGRMLVCILAISLPAIILGAFLPQVPVIVGALLGAILGVVAISALCGMSVGRSAIAAGVYFAIQVALWGVLQVIL